MAACLFAGCDDDDEEQTGTGGQLPQHIGKGGSITFFFETGDGAAVKGHKVTYTMTNDQPASGRNPVTGVRYHPTRWHWSGYAAGADSATLTMWYSSGREVYIIKKNKRFEYTGYRSNGSVWGTAKGPWTETPAP